MKIRRMSYHNGEIGVNTENYYNEVKNITKEARLKIYDTFCSLIHNPNTFDKKEKIQSGIDTYHLIHTLDDIKFFHTRKNIGGQNNAGSVIVEINNKKYFCKLYNYKDKKYDPYKDPSREVIGLMKTHNAGYKTIKPILYYKNHDMGVIVYPYIENIETFTEYVMKKGLDQNGERIKQYINQVSDTMEANHNVKDIKRENTHLDGDDIYFFDTIYLGPHPSKHKNTGKNIL